MKELKEAFSFPSYFGENLDAVWDCMTDLAWTNADGFHIRIHGWKGVDKDPKFDYKTFLNEVKAFWEGKNNGGNERKIPFLIEYI